MQQDKSNYLFNVKDNQALICDMSVTFWPGNICSAGLISLLSSGLQETKQICNTYTEPIKTPRFKIDHEPKGGSEQKQNETWIQMIHLWELLVSSFINSAWWKEEKKTTRKLIPAAIFIPTHSSQTTHDRLGHSSHERAVSAVWFG